MNRTISAMIAVAVTLSACPLSAQTPPRDSAFYEQRLKDPILEEIEDRNKKWDAERDKLTAKLKAKQKKESKAKEDSATVLRAALPEQALPDGPGSFDSAFHFEPQAQYYTGTCWAYAATSYLESEAHRISGRKIKLSEMHTVYYEYLEKARRFVQERGASHFGEGYQHNAVTRMWKQYGAVPLDAYRGIVAEDGLHDHIRMYREMRSFLDYVKKEDIWDEKWVLSVIAEILDKYMGPPPLEFTYKRKKYTPGTFVEKVLKVNPDDYVGFISTMKQPFFTKGEFEVEDNWWHDKGYNNIPLDLFYDTLLSVVKSGYSVAIGGDVSEPGKNFRQDVAFVPTFDIPADYIDQSSREYRIASGSTGDDHGIHLLGWAEKEGKNWFLIKDSGRSARHGRFEGYYFFREDYIRLKMLSYMVHKDAVKEVLEKIKEPAPEPAPANKEEPTT